MIPLDYIVAWRAHAPWALDSQVEQDLVLSRALVSLYSHPLLSRELAFRGGTALHKLVFKPPARYSEDIDLVQVNAGPAGALMTAVRECLDPWLGKPRFNQGAGRVTFYYRFKSEAPPVVPMRLKVEINTREHFAVLGHVTEQVSVQNPWFSGEANVLTFVPEELLGTKLRALYQRKKGRDVLDLALALEHGGADPKKIVACFKKYMEHGETSVSRAEYEENLGYKRLDPLFLEDVRPLLPERLRDFDLQGGLDAVLNKLICLLPGKPWKETDDLRQ